MFTVNASHFKAEHSSKPIASDGLIFKDDEERELWRKKRNPIRLLSLDIGRVPKNGWGDVCMRATIHLNLKKIRGQIKPQRTIYLELYRIKNMFRKQFAMVDLSDFIEWASWFGDIRRGLEFDRESGGFKPRHHNIRLFNKDIWQYYTGKIPEVREWPVENKSKILYIKGKTPKDDGKIEIV